MVTIAPALPTPRRAAVSAVVVVLGILAAYHNAFHGAWVLDDHSAILENASIRSLRDMAAVLSPPATAGVGGRPIANLTFAVNHAISGYDAWSYRAFNLGLHAGTALLLLGVVRRTLDSPALTPHFGTAALPLATATALLWALHPLTTSAVDYVSQRTELLMAFFYLLALYAFIRAATAARSAGWSGLALVACAAGMASKEVMVTAPVVIVLYDRAFLASSFRHALSQRWKLHAALAATWLVLIVLMQSSPVAERGVGFGQGITAVTYAFTQCRALLTYLALAFWPASLVFDYGWSFISDWADAWPYVLAVAVLIAGAALAWRARPALGFAGAWFFVLLAPTSTIIPIVQQPVAENRMYLPLAGVVGLGVCTLHLAFRRRGFAVVTCAAVAAGGLTLQRNLDYADAVALWRDTVAKRPANARAHNNLAGALLRAGRPAEALPQAREAARLRPQYADAHVNLGTALAAGGDAAAAAEHYREATRLDPVHAAAHANLGKSLLQLGSAATAQAHLETALRLDPSLAAAHNDLGVLLFESGEVDAAFTHLQAAVRLAPAMADGHYNLGNALARLGRWPEAVAAYQQALRLKPDFVKAHHNLGVAFLVSGQPAKAVAQFESTLRLNPSHPDARRNLDVARSRLRP